MLVEGEPLPFGVSGLMKQESPSLEGGECQVIVPLDETITTRLTRIETAVQAQIMRWGGFHQHPFSVNKHGVCAIVHDIRVERFHDFVKH
jgi:hypothetical protein